MRETRGPRSLAQLRVISDRLGADVLANRITRRQYDGLFAKVETDLAAHGWTFLDLLDLPRDSLGGRGEAVAAGPRQGTGAGG
jgi:hypothetical protein